MSAPRFIVHVDMDAFFAAIEQRDDPSLRGRPVVVGADPKAGAGRGVVAAASYEARRFGIHSAMPISTAYKKCPQAAYVRGDHEKYERESERIMRILERFTPDIEPISIDEAFLDITRSHHLFGTAEETCRRIKQTIKAETGLTASLGLAPNMMTAKIASDIGKPDGFVVVTPENLLSFLHPLPVERLWGVGPKTRQEFVRVGILTIGDLARRDLKDLERRFGQSGSHAWRLANGIDPREVHGGEAAKSMGAEHTFDEDVADKKVLLDTLMDLTERVSLRLRKEGLAGRTITLKIRLSGYVTHTRAESLAEPTNFADVIFKCAAARMEEFLGGRKIRLLGVAVSHLIAPEEQPGLFEEMRPGEAKKERLHRAVEKIKDKFGARAIGRRLRP